MANVPGTEINLGGKIFVLPPLTLGQLRNGLLAKLKRYDELVAQGEQFEGMSLSGEIILAALRRNYSTKILPDAEFWDRIDLGNSGPAFRAVLGLSGFTSPGEPLAAMEDGTSTPSTLPSPPPTDGTTSA